MNKIKIANKKVGVNIQGYLNNIDEWSEGFAKKWPYETRSNYIMIIGK